MSKGVKVLPSLDGVRTIVYFTEILAVLPSVDGVRTIVYFTEILAVGEGHFRCHQSC